MRSVDAPRNPIKDALAIFRFPGMWLPLLCETAVASKSRVWAQAGVESWRQAQDSVMGCSFEVLVFKIRRINMDIPGLGGLEGP